MDWNIRTDLAIDNREIYRKAEHLEEEIPGIITREEMISDDLKVTEVEIQTQEGEKALGKPIGKYYTIDAKYLALGIEESNNQIEETISEILQKILELNENDKVLVVGLGNEAVTPDSLGPKVISQIEVTSHLIQFAPEYVKEGTRWVSAIVPGVLGTTGIETGEMIKAIIEKIMPDKIIVIDALAAKDMKRIKSTIQISDTGIIPGAGVGNNRKRLNQETLGVPVIAIGVPTVVDAKTIVRDALDKFMEKERREEKLNDGYIQLLQEKFPEIEINSIVTPTEIDEIVTNVSTIIANAINTTLN